MAESYDGMVWSGSLWGGGGIDMSWLDGMTGCWGDCPIDSQSVSFSNFKLLDGDHGTPTTTTSTVAPPTTSRTTQPSGPTTTSQADHSCPGGNLRSAQLRNNSILVFWDILGHCQELDLTRDLYIYRCFPVLALSK